MKPSAMFNLLGAPLVNVRWSWGGVRPDGSVILRVWQDEVKKVESGQFVRVTNFRRYGELGSDLGSVERMAHLERIRNGAKCFMIMCLAKDPFADPREIKSLNSEDVFVGGEMIPMEGDLWIRIADRVKVKDVI